jgi:decaprenyl-phosphate phosphoribosyltransferase
LQIIRDYLRLARPHQYIKNCFVFLPIFFDYKFGEVDLLINVFVAFFCFSSIASAVYIINDLCDIAVDQLHPVKKNRPLASGRIRKKEAVIFGGTLVSLSMCVSYFFLSKSFLVVILAYFFLNLCYSNYLKHIAIIDVACISSGFVLRIFGGAVVASITPSHWIVLLTYLLAMFLALAKRRDDLLLLQSGNSVRKCLSQYNMDFISLSMVLMAAITIVSYIRNSVLSNFPPKLIHKK